MTLLPLSRGVCLLQAQYRCESTINWLFNCTYTYISGICQKKQMVQDMWNITLIVEDDERDVAWQRWWQRRGYPDCLLRWCVIMCQLNLMFFDAFDGLHEWGIVGTLGGMRWWRDGWFLTVFGREGPDVDGRRRILPGTRDSNYPNVISKITYPYLHHGNLGIFYKS